MSVNYEFISKSMSDLSGIPVRVYRDKEEICRHFPVKLPKDPMEIYQKDIFAISEHIGFYVTPLFHYYGVLNSGNIKIIIGPTSQIMANDQKLRELGFLAGIPQDEMQIFVSEMNHIGRISVDTLLVILSTMNHFLNDGEIIELKDLAIHETMQKEIKNNIEKKRTSESYEEDDSTHQPHNTLSYEEAMMDIIRKGDSVTLKRWISSLPAIQSGTMAGDQLRQMKNIFIVTATLASRAAIRGGLSEDDALSLSDAYVQRAELLSSHSSIVNLQYNMILEFTEQVEKLHRTNYVTKLSLDVANYVRHHLSEKISVDKMAEDLFLSRPYLSSKFKQETGISLTDFILSEKTEEAKRLLRYSDKSLSDISEYLCFSSHGHFSRVFKKYTGMTPNEYREKQS